MHLEEQFARFLHALLTHRQEGSRREPGEHADDHAAVHEIFQTSTINAVLEGIYDGEVTYAAVRQHGDFGLGTFNALDGEMIALDGEFYQIRADGVATPVEPAQKTPFAVVQFFEPDVRVTLDREMELRELLDCIDQRVAARNLFYAIRIDGSFPHVKARSVPRQSRPYPALAEVAKTQPVFEFRNVRGTLAGFRFPDYTQGINVPGYHLHFITADRRAGGHLLDCRLARGELALDHTADFHMELPSSGEFLTAPLGGDHQEELRQAER